MKQLSRVLMCAAVMLFLFSGQGYAVTGPCYNCHTMHNSQDGVDQSLNFDDSTSANENLLKGDCLGCHAKTGSATIDTSLGGDIPQVMPTGASGILAGGSFDYVYGAGGADANGHNVAALVPTGGGDVPLGNTPPGDSGTFTGPLTCAGTTGCHGNRGTPGDVAAMSGAHHSNNTATGATDGSTLGLSYRFLDGISGFEDADWEATVSASDHNQYKGIARSAPTDTAPPGPDGAISGLCGKCHGIFHNGNDNLAAGASMGSPWIRHPTDLDMGSAAGEHASYGGASNDYIPAVPVASEDVSQIFATAPPGTAGRAIVMCLSCHRAHGSEHADILRFDYANMEVGSTTNAGEGCFACHTAKDGA